MGEYHRWVASMCATRHNLKIDFVAWRQQLEDVRKDIECMFGVFKDRCRILKTPYMFHKKDDIDKLLLTCVDYATYCMSRMVAVDWNAE